MTLAREETFGPIAPLFRFKTEKEGIETANATGFDLAYYFCARDICQVFRVGGRHECGIIGNISTAEVPFGGVKESGLGRERSHRAIEGISEVVAYTALFMQATLWARPHIRLGEFSRGSLSVADARELPGDVYRSALIGADCSGGIRDSSFLESSADLDPA